MKLRNKKTGEIGYTAVLRSKAIVVMDENAIQLGSYTSLAELNAEWEDYEEPKEYWFFSGRGEVRCIEDENTVFDKDHKSIGNYFSSREEAELALSKLKAWKRLKDKGFRFTDDFTYGEYYGCGSIRFIIFPSKKEKYVKDDLDLLFGGEE